MMTASEHLTLAVRASGFFTILLTVYAAIARQIGNHRWDEESVWTSGIFLVIGFLLLRKGHWITAFATADERK